MDAESACPTHGTPMLLPPNTAFKCRDGTVRVSVANPEAARRD